MAARKGRRTFGFSALAGATGCTIDGAAGIAVERLVSEGCSLERMGDWCGRCTALTRRHLRTHRNSMREKRVRSAKVAQIGNRKKMVRQIDELTIGSRFVRALIFPRLADLGTEAAHSPLPFWGPPKGLKPYTI